MNSRERVLRAVNFERPDRVPIDLGGIRATGINAVVYDELKRRMGIRTPTRIHDTMQILADVELDVLERLHVDVVPLDAGDMAWQGKDAGQGVKTRLFCGLEVYFPPNTNITVEQDGSWALRNQAGDSFARMPKDGFYFDYVQPTMASRRIDPTAFQPRRTVSDEELDFMARRGRTLYESTDKAILGWAASISMIGLSYLLSDNITQGSLQEWMLMLMTEKDAAHEMMGRYVDSVIDRIRLYHQAVGKYCFAWGIGSDDAGTQRGEFISPDLFVEMVKPHYRRLCEWVHTHTAWKTYRHSCGSIYHLIPEWIDAGVDILNPVQISAADMEPERLMRDFGGRIVFWGGGCDAQRVLPLGTPQEVRGHVGLNLKAFARADGGYVFTQVHNIQQNVPVENVEEMFAAAYEFGRSPQSGE